MTFEMWLAIAAYLIGIGCGSWRTSFAEAVYRSVVLMFVFMIWMGAQG